MEHTLNDTDKVTRRKAYLNVVSYTTDPHMEFPGWNRDLRGGIPACTHDTAEHIIVAVTNNENSHDDMAETTILDGLFHSWPQLTHLTHRNDRVYVWCFTEQAIQASSNQDKNKGQPNRARVKKKKHKHHAIFLFFFYVRET